MIDSYLFPYALIFLLTLVLTVFMCRLIIPFLKKRAEQPIYTEGPSWHIAKTGTPTMGGLSFVFSVSSVLILSALYKYLANDAQGVISLFICLIYAMFNASVGIIDDLTKLRHNKNAGLSPRAKFILQFLSSILFLLARRLFLNDSAALSLSFIKIDSELIYYFISLIILVGITNCANLTDGVDGLASSVAFGIGISLFYMSYARFGTASIICISLAAAALGFLFFNVHPARIFMGDTGSLFLGSLVGALAFEMSNPFIAVVSGGVYVIEGISVILQVAFYKMTKRRLFKMAPLHHHLEKCGWDENKICLCALILTILFTAVVFFVCR